MEQNGPSRRSRRKAKGQPTRQESECQQGQQGNVGLSAACDRRPPAHRLSLDPHEDPSRAISSTAVSVLAWGLAAEDRDQLPDLALTALGACGRLLLQAVMFADRDAHLKAIAATLAFEFVDSHGFPPPTSAHHQWCP